MRNTPLHHTGRLEKSIQAQAGNTHCIALPEGMALEMMSKASGVMFYVSYQVNALEESTDERSQMIY